MYVRPTDMFNCSSDKKGPESKSYRSKVRETNLLTSDRPIIDTDSIHENHRFFLKIPFRLS